MDMMQKIKELRAIIPIPVGEALRLMKDNDGNIEQCAELFKAKSIKEICSQTGCSEEMAKQYYGDEKYDLNRTISSIKETIYDENYKPIEGVTKENIRSVLQWIGMMESKDFAFSLDYIHLDNVIETLRLIPALTEIAVVIKTVKAVKDKIFEGYTDNLPLDEFVRRHKRLDDNPDFRQANAALPLKVTVMKDELLRHLRNLQ